MKLRIRGNTLRLRLSQNEVATVEANGSVADVTLFPGGEQLAYVLAVAEDIDAATAQFAAGTITVSISRSTLTTWLNPSEVSIHGSQPLAGGEQLQILVEKDFACLVPREGEDQENLFPNPGNTAC